ncbi:MAG: hypothetical protein M1836_006370 [Candelina mexicana]|nr:MAG: hypothetical protein M1836_006370 [Candelina mexicana]
MGCEGGRLAGGEEWPPVAFRRRAAVERAFNKIDPNVGLAAATQALRLAESSADSEAVLAAQKQASESTELLGD